MPEPASNPDTPGRTNGFVERGGGWVVGQFAWMIAIGAGGFWWPGSRPGGWVMGLAMVLGGLGGWIGILGALHLGKSRTAYPKPRTGGELVVTGVYGWMRHPLYASLILLGLGWTMGRWSGLAGISTLGLAWFLDAKARREERWLEREYPGYGDYRRRVRRFLPGIY